MFYRFSQITPEHVNIAHRLSRPVYDKDNDNAGAPFTGEVARRETYADHPDWPLINRFPKPNVAYAPKVTEILEYCPRFTVLPDYYKFWALANGMAGRCSL